MSAEGLVGEGSRDVLGDVRREPGAEATGAVDDLFGGWEGDGERCERDRDVEPGDVRTFCRSLDGSVVALAASSALSSEVVIS